jgi:hypothetical protein
MKRYSLQERVRISAHKRLWSTKLDPLNVIKTKLII